MNVEAQAEATMRASHFITRRINRALAAGLTADDAPAAIVALTRCLRETIGRAPEAERESLLTLMLECLGIDALFDSDDSPEA